MNTVFFESQSSESENIIINSMRIIPKDTPFTCSDNMFRVIFVAKENCELNLNGCEYHCNESTIIFINSHSTYTISKISDNGEVWLGLIAKTFFSEQMRERFTDLPIFYHFLNYCSKISKNGSSHMIIQMSSEKTHQLVNLLFFWEGKQNKHCLQNFFLSLASFCYYKGENFEIFRDQNVKADKKEIIELLNYIHDNYRDVNLNNLAKKFHYSPNYLSDLIRQNTHLTFSQHLCQRRMEVAKYLIQQDNAMIKNVIKKIGYGDKSSFYRQFTKHFGMTPSEMRKHAKQSK